MADQLVTVWRYRDLPEALIARAKLDSQQIWCILADDNIVRLDWFWSNFVGGVGLQVADEDAQLALALLSEEIPESFTAEEIGEEYRQPSCPQCGSRDITLGERYNQFALTLLGLSLVSLPYFILPALLMAMPKHLWTCEDCGKQWSAEYD